MKTKLHLLFIVLALFASSFIGAAQGTAFTYQGSLSDASGSANGSYDITYSLYNASTGGSQVGSTITASGTVISNGLFTATLDFGNVFGSTSYWLQLAVRTNGAPSFAVLAPRQELTPTPYAITAENVTGSIQSSQLTGTVADSSLPPDVALLDAASQTFTGNNSFSGNIDILDPTKTILFPATSGANAPMMAMFASGTDNADRMVIAHSLFFPNWGLQYQDSSDTFNFLRDGTPILSIGLASGYVYTYGSLGVGTSAAQQMLSVVGGLNVDQANDNDGFLNNGNTNGYGITFGSTSGEGIASERQPGGNQYGLDFYTEFNNRMSISQSGLVGINTTNSAAQLEVDAPSTVSVLGVSGLGQGGEISSSGDFYPAAGEFVGDNGVIGIGTTNVSNSYGVIGVVGGYGDAVYGNSSTTNGIGVYALGTGTGSALTIGAGAFHISGASTNNPNTTAFIQFATAANTSGYITIINNSLCNGDPAAILIATHSYNPSGVTGSYETNPFSVWYNGSNWTIYNDNKAAILGMAFNVLIIKN